MVAVGVITRIINARSQAKYFAPIGTTPGCGITTTCQVSHVTCVLQLTGILQEGGPLIAHYRMSCDALHAADKRIFRWSCVLVNLLLRCC